MYFELFERIFRDAGYRLKVLETTGLQETKEGLRYVNNDACLPNHHTGRGIIKGLNELYGANIVAIDYDEGVSVVNQDKRIKLMMSIAASWSERIRQMNRASCTKMIVEKARP